MKKLHVQCVVVLLFIGLLTGCAKGNETIQMSFTGDILLSRGVQKHLDQWGTDYPYENISQYLIEDDVSIGNLECPLTVYEYAVHKERSILFRASPQNAVSLRENGFDLLNLANNHSMDQGKKGMGETLETLEKEDLIAIGAGKSKGEAQRLKILTVKGRKIGFMGVSVFPPEGYIYSSEDPDVSLYSHEQSPALVSEAKAQCDYLVVMIHWGAEYSRYASKTQKEIAHTLIEHGADALIGHHPHVLQGVEKYQGKMIFYSLGNFIFDRQMQSGTDETMLLQLEWSDQNEEWSMIPLKIRECQPRLANEEESLKIMEDIEQRSNGLIELRANGNRWIIDIPQE